ncbi:MAG: argininosuccinate lyase [Actinomycetota bacterium]
MAESEVSWAGRFGEGPDPEMLELTRSIATDIRLLGQDGAATAAHARALGRAGLMTETDVAAVEDLCRNLRPDELGDAGVAEDVHSLVERFLTERLGDAGRRIHAGRSRNDLVAADLRLWCRAKAEELVHLVCDLVDTIAGIAEEHHDAVMPGYTHLQRAQPVTLGFHLAAHGFALLRDAGRFTRAAEQADVSPLGAGALAGSTLELDPDALGRDLGFRRAFENAMDVVADRDFACDLVYAASLCAIHLSRVAEEIVLWASSEFGFVRLHDAWSTGSSMMPQKRNPDVAELVRGRAALGIGDIASLLGLLKGLPLAYNRDLQEDKTVVFAAVDRVGSSLRSLDRLLASLTFDRAAMACAAAGSAWATDLAERLVARGVPFRDAHAAVGRVVADLERRGARLGDDDGEALSAAHAELRAADVDVDDPAASVEARASHGGTAPARVLEQVASLRRTVAGLRRG